ncbi:50S ribosomal protein L13 [bacterium]|jgi:large subunit ribosomal protein L13|nr:50S ribosomal protein L13 [bacterium]MDP6571476.1 50S ribosomal protein L13 [Patescibacteria group bacterium]MDP6756175.1 50S ribosomal protein L13 [Patescibacteria group bacterium]|tara:strand:- start:49598 stop:49951 length:354 start_codon:yes stop_codon:yes gene_type:complete
MNKATTIDAEGISLGRVAAQAAHILMGKDKANYVPYKDQGGSVVVTNFKKVKITGNKLEQKRYYSPTTRVGALKSETLGSLMSRRPNEVLRKAVMGMLPKNSLRREMIKRLTIKAET